MEWIEYGLAILSGLAVTIPLVIKLVQYIQVAVKEKNWKQLLEFVMKLMEVAETKFQDGAERKEWVLTMVKASADTINYDIDYEVVSEMIDGLCNLSKVINPKEPIVEKVGEQAT